MTGPPAAGHETRRKDWLCRSSEYIAMIQRGESPRAAAGATGLLETAEKVRRWARKRMGCKDPERNFKVSKFKRILIFPS